MPKSLVATAVALCIFSAPAEAQLFDRTVPVGRTTEVFIYKPFSRRSCTPALAIATLSVKPQHGRVSHFYRQAEMPRRSRFTGRQTGCGGRSVRGFVVTYTPAPGFYGTDSFIIDVDFKEVGGHAVDVFRIHVIP